jgi:hypothetical protein
MTEKETIGKALRRLSEKTNANAFGASMYYQEDEDSIMLKFTFENGDAVYHTYFFAEGDLVDVLLRTLRFTVFLGKCLNQSCIS